MPHIDLHDGSEADTVANALYTSLTGNAPVPPTVDLSGADYTYVADLTSEIYKSVESITLAQLTEKDLEGAGVFDTLMASVDLHIAREFKSNRITGDQYAKVYTDVMTSVLANSTQFLLNKDKARWDSITAQMLARAAEINVVTSKIDLERAKVETQKLTFDMQNSAAQFSVTKLQLAQIDGQISLTEANTFAEAYRAENILPAQLSEINYNVNTVLPSNVALTNFQVSDVLPAKIAIDAYQVSTSLPAKVALDNYELTTALPAKVGLDAYQLTAVLPAQVGLDAYRLASILPVERDTAAFNLATTLVTEDAVAQYGLTQLLPIQKAQEQYKVDTQLPAQVALVQEQTEVQRGQTMNTRTDGTTDIAGIVGRQSAVLAEQHESERAKTLDTRTDTTTVVGSIGKQKDLYGQQITSYQRDAEYKSAKMFLDGWIIQKNIDEGLTIPVELNNTTVDKVMAKIRVNNDLGTVNI